MKNYTHAVEYAGQMFLGQLPEETLENMKPVRTHRINRRMEKFVGKQIQKAGEDFLKSIHQEIYDGLSVMEKEKIKDELDELAGKKEVVGKCDEFGKPELTADYLRSIGREDMIEWGTDRP